VGAMTVYDTAQICQNGHVINSFSTTESEYNQKYCEKCGAPTITLCPKCQTPIRGKLIDEFSFMGNYLRPSFCINCGNPYPWTESKLIAAHELANEVGDLNEEDRNILQTSIDDLVKDTPSSNVAAIRFKKIMQKVGPVVATMFREILIDVLSETAKKMLFPS
jgi:hypothetical protein